MFLYLVATVAAGFALAGVFMLFRTLTRKRLPRWLIPVMAGGGMMGFHLWFSYTWFQRDVAELPDRVQVVETYETSEVFQPWTLIWPQVHAYMAVDSLAQRHPQAQHLWLVEVVERVRFQGQLRTPVIVDCQEPGWAQIRADAQPDAQGIPQGLDWARLPAEAPLIATVCP